MWSQCLDDNTELSSCKVIHKGLQSILLVIGNSRRAKKDTLTFDDNTATMPNVLCNINPKLTVQNSINSFLARHNSGSKEIYSFKLTDR